MVFDFKGLISGRKLTTEEYKEMAETNIKETLKEGTFTLKEKQAFLHNRMMAYVENCIYGGKWDEYKTREK